MITEWLMSQEGQILYLLIFLTLIGGAFFLPFPEDLILLIVGVLAQRGLIEWEWAFLTAYCSILIGDTILYSIGYKFGINLFSKRWFRNRIHPSKIKAVRTRLDKNYILAIFFGRHLFYLRSITFICCGAVKMKFLKYLLADALAALLSTSIMITLGYFASENYQNLSSYIKKSEIILASAIIIGLIFWLYKKKTKKINEKKINELD